MPSSFKAPRTLLYFCWPSVIIPPVVTSPEVSFHLHLAILDPTASAKVQTLSPMSGGCPPSPAQERLNLPQPSHQHDSGLCFFFLHTIVSPFTSIGRGQVWTQGAAQIRGCHWILCFFCLGGVWVVSLSNNHRSCTWRGQQQHSSLIGKSLRCWGFVFRFYADIPVWVGDLCSSHIFFERKHSDSLYYLQSTTLLPSPFTWRVPPDPHSALIQPCSSPPWCLFGCALCATAQGAAFNILPQLAAWRSLAFGMFSDVKYTAVMWHIEGDVLSWTEERRKHPSSSTACQLIQRAAMGNN